VQWFGILPFAYYSSTVAVDLKVGGEVLFGSLTGGGPFLGMQLCRYVKACTTPYVSTCGEGGWTAAGWRDELSAIHTKLFSLLPH
jgi:hypothetical protein